MMLVNTCAARVSLSAILQHASSTHARQCMAVTRSSTHAREDDTLRRRAWMDGGGETSRSTSVWCAMDEESEDRRDLIIFTQCYLLREAYLCALCVYLVVVYTWSVCVVCLCVVRCFSQ